MHAAVSHTLLVRVRRATLVPPAPTRTSASPPYPTTRESRPRVVWSRRACLACVDGLASRRVPPLPRLFVVLTPRSASSDRSAPSVSRKTQASPAARPRFGASRSAKRAIPPRAAASAPCELVACEADFAGTAATAANVNGKIVLASALRAVNVTSSSGSVASLGSIVGDKGVLVLLRHLG